jgi:hypothetical protein
MTLEKAIELLSLDKHAASSISREAFLEANQLGIEAMNRIKERRYLNTGSWLPLLPGETKE